MTLGDVAEPHRVVLFAVQPDGEAFIEDFSGGIRADRGLT
jgi:hypothetical protein